MHHRMKKGTALEILQGFAEMFETDIYEDCNRHHIDLPDSLGNGQMVIYTSQEGLGTLILQASLKKDWVIEFEGQMRDPISFYTVGEGEITASSCHFEFTVNALQSTIHGGFGPTDYSIKFSAGESISCMIILVDKTIFFEKMACDMLDVPSDLLGVVQNMNEVDTNFIFQDIFHLPLVNTLQEIMSQENGGLVNSTFAAAKIYENIYLQLNVYKQYDQEESVRVFRDEEKFKIVKNAEKILVSRLQGPPTIPELARMVGTNMQTLKVGFRQLYGETINQYLNEKRLEQAGILMRAGELSIKEIALAVGYSNASYFSKRFKDKYGVNPRQFNSTGSGVSD